MTKVRVFFEGDETFSVGYFDGEKLIIKGVYFTPEMLIKANGVARTVLKPVFDEMQAKGYPVEKLLTTQARWEKKFEMRFNIKLTKQEREALQVYCDENEIPAKQAILGFVRICLGLNFNQPDLP